MGGVGFGWGDWGWVHKAMNSSKKECLAPEYASLFSCLSIKSLLKQFGFFWLEGLLEGEICSGAQTLWCHITPYPNSHFYYSSSPNRHPCQVSLGSWFFLFQRATKWEVSCAVHSPKGCAKQKVTPKTTSTVRKRMDYTIGASILIGTSVCPKMYSTFWVSLIGVLWCLTLRSSFPYMSLTTLLVY